MATVLLVEGDDQVRVLAESYLEEQGHDVLSAGTAVGALALLEKSSVLYTTERNLTDGMKARFVKNSAFLAKPYTVEQLLTTLAVHFRISPQARRQPVNA